MRTTVTESERTFLEKPYVGVVTTLALDGSPQSTVVWVDVDDAEISVNTAHGRVKPATSLAIRASHWSSSIRAIRIGGSR